MVCTRRSKDVSSEFERQRLLDVSSSSSCSRSFPKGSSRLPPKPSTGSDLTRIAPLTSKAIARMCATEAKAAKRATRGESFTMGSKEATIYKSDCDLDFNVSRVT